MQGFAIFFFYFCIVYANDVHLNCNIINYLNK